MVFIICTYIYLIFFTFKASYATKITHLFAAYISKRTRAWKSYFKKNLCNIYIYGVLAFTIINSVVQRIR